MALGREPEEVGLAVEGWLVGPPSASWNVRLTGQELELEAKALLKRAARIEAEAVTQREQARRLIEHLAEPRREAKSPPA